MLLLTRVQICKDVEEAETWFLGLRVLLDRQRLRPRVGEGWASAAHSAASSSFDSLSDFSPSASPFHPRAAGGAAARKVRKGRGRRGRGGQGRGTMKIGEVAQSGRGNDGW